MDRRGFTLIELLVVISIIGLLAAILMPELQRSRVAAQAAACASNLRELGMATQMYLDDYEAYFPYYTTVAAGQLWYFGLESPFNPNGAPGTRNIDLTKAKLYPYLQTRQGIQVCPAYNYHSSLWRQKYNQMTDGYGLNVNLFGVSPNSPTNSPGRVVCFADTAQINTFQPPASSSHPMIEEFYYCSPTEKTTHFRHSARANVLFCDGHVDAMPMVPDTLDTSLPQENVGRLNRTGDTSLFW